MGAGLPANTARGTRRQSSSASPLALEAGKPVPGREHFVLERQLGRTLGSEVWLARQPRSRDARVFKFALDTEHLAAIKREATLLRVLRETLGEREDIVRLLDWNFAAIADASSSARIRPSRKRRTGRRAPSSSYAEHYTNKATNRKLSLLPATTNAGANYRKTPSRHRYSTTSENSRPTFTSPARSSPTIPATGT